jgi:hypothetical protein
MGEIFFVGPTDLWGKLFRGIDGYGWGFLLSKIFIQANILRQLRFTEFGDLKTGAYRAFKEMVH